MTFQGKLLDGTCIGPNVRAGNGLSSVSLHVMSSNALLCGLNDITGKHVNRGGPQPPPPMTSPNVNYGATYYGKNVSPFVFDSNLKFDLAEISEWDESRMIGFYETFYAPRFQNSTTYKRLMLRNQIETPFQGVENVNWTPADLSVYEDDWLGNLMPGGWCYSSRGVPEPMLGQTYFEDARKPEDPPNLVDKTNSSIRENWTPLCNPINVFNSEGSNIGTFDGISYIAFFNAACVKVPVKKRKWDSTATNPITLEPTGAWVGDMPLGVLPRDFTLTPLTETPRPWLDPKRQIINLEIWFYLSSSNGSVLKSPRIATVRFWHYTKGVQYIDSGTYDSPFSPYLFLSTESAGAMNVEITFPLLQNENNPDELEIKVSNMKFGNFLAVLGA